LRDICFYKLLDQVWVFPETFKGRAFCKGLPPGPVNEELLVLTLEKENLTYRKKNYE
jgi:hypothetical protein